ncbi:hypothetical protein H113_00932 [Trichophyton rubrum MR1459]|nr:hypothetical protein H113_00932 [Trichophyton rubrum MR1459]
MAVQYPQLTANNQLLWFDIAALTKDPQAEWPTHGETSDSSIEPAKGIAVAYGVEKETWGKIGISKD